MKRVSVRKILGAAAIAGLVSFGAFASSAPANAQVVTNDARADAGVSPQSATTDVSAQRRRYYRRYGYRPRVYSRPYYRPYGYAPAPYYGGGGYGYGYRRPGIYLGF